MNNNFFKIKKKYMKEDILDERINYIVGHMPQFGSNFLPVVVQVLLLFLSLAASKCPVIIGAE